MPGCSQCFNNICVSAPCHLECRVTGDTCETLVNGGGDEGLLSKNTAKFLPLYVVEESSPLLEAAGIKPGDLITHVDLLDERKPKFPSTVKAFGMMVRKLKKGHRVFVYRSKDDREWKTL